MHDAPACEFAPRISAYYDGELGEDESREVARHLAECSACTGQLAFYTKVSGRFHEPAPPRLGHDARQRLEGLHEEVQAEFRRIKPSADVRWVRRLTAAAAILFVVAAGKVIYQQRFADQRHNDPIPVVNPDLKNPGTHQQKPVIDPGRVAPATDQSATP